MELTNEQLFEKYHAETDVYQKELILDCFFKKNRKLAHFMACQIKHPTLSYKDKVGLANIGMVKAFNAFDLTRGLAFVTLATIAMRNEILLQIRKEERHVGVYSLDAVMHITSEGSELTIMDTLADETDITSDIEYTDFLQNVKTAATRVLTDKEQIVLQSLLSDEPATQLGLGNQLGISQSYASRMIKKVRRKMVAHFKETS